MPFDCHKINPADLACEKQSWMNTKNWDDLIIDESKALHMNQILVVLHSKWTQGCAQVMALLGLLVLLG